MNDLRKTPVPEGALRLQVDDPQGHSIERPVGVLRGWFATRDLEILEGFTFSIGGITLPHSIVSREDVEDAMPDYTIVGFEIPYDLSSYLVYVQDTRLVIHVKLPDYAPLRLRFRISDSALAICLATAGGV